MKPKTRFTDIPELLNQDGDYENPDDEVEEDEEGDEKDEKFVSQWH